MFPSPTFFHERELMRQGYRMIVGVDEVGCGALAGPVLASAVILPLTSRLSVIKDSKLLSKQQREVLYPRLIARVSAWAVGDASVEEIMKYGLRQATFLAMRRAVAQISGADYALVDAWKIPDLRIQQRNIVRGDRLIKSIAAASIIAKVTRDRLMQQYAEQFPAYAFDVNKGYATLQHRLAIAEFGPCPIHRLTYKTFDKYCSQDKSLTSSQRDRII